MNNNENDRNDQGNQDGQFNPDTNKTNDAVRRNLMPDNSLPYEDPAITNPEELASFPKKAKIVNATEVERESENHLVNNRTPVREGRNIVRTDNNPDTDGFM